MKLQKVAGNGGFGLLVLIATMIYTSSFVLLLMDTNSIGPDESMNVWVGKSMTQGSYPEDFTHRPPLVPAMIAISILTGLGIHWGRVLVPLVFMNLLVIGTYLFSRSLFGRKEAIVSLVFLMGFPFFWRWGMNVLTDIPLAAVSALSLAFFYMGVETHKKYLFPSAVFFAAGALLKFSVFLFIPPMLIFLACRKKLSILRSEEFIISAVMIPLIFFLTFLVFNILCGASFMPARQLTFFENPKTGLSEMSNLVFAPLLLFSAAGIGYGLKRRGKGVFLLLLLVFFGGFFMLTYALRLRYLAPLIPVLAALAASGFFSLARTRIRRLVYGLFALFMILSVLASLFIVNLEEGYQWGAEELLDNIETLELGAKVASEYMPYFLRAASTREVVPIPTYVRFGYRTMAYPDFVGIHLNSSHPDYPDVQRYWTPRNYTKYNSFDYTWLAENGVDYFVVSIYSEFERNPSKGYYSPKIGPFEMPFIRRPYSSDNPPDDYVFSSEAFREIENNPGFELVKDIKKGEKTVFKIYRVVG